MATNKNFEVKNGLTIAGTERISSAGAFTGSLASATTATTQSAADSSTKIATTAYTDAAITALIGGAPSALNDLNELAAAIADDENYSTTLTTALATKAPLASPTFTGTLEIPNLTISSAQGSDGQVLTSTGSGIAWENVAAGYTDSDVETYLNTSEIYTDATNNRLGIGASSPAAPLHVNITGAGDAVKIQGNSITDFDFVGNPPEFNLEDIGSSTNTKRARITVDSNKISIQGLGDDDATLNHTFFSGDLSNGNVTLSDYVQLGSIGTSTGSATPTEINLGSLFADSAGSPTKAKLKIYEDTNGNVYGLGVSAGTFENHLQYSAGKYDWYIGTNRKMRITHDGIIDLKTNNTGALVVPNGTTAQRPTGANGMIRYNTTDAKLEGYIDSSWQPITAGIPSLTTISGLDLWMDVTGGISSATIADLSGNSRTGTASSTTNKGTVGSNTYMLCNSNNYIEYANGKIPNYAADVTYFFVSTNITSLAGLHTYLGQASGSTAYQIIRTASNVNTWNFYFTSQGNVNLAPTNTGHNVNSTVGNSTQIHTFSFGSQANGNLTVYKRTGGTNTSDVFPNNSFPGGNANHQWVANSNATRLGNSSWADEFLGGGIFAWGIIDHEITATELGVIYDYYSDKGLGS